MAVLLIAAGVLGMVAWISKDSGPRPTTAQAEPSPADSNAAAVVPIAKPAQRQFDRASRARRWQDGARACLENEHEEFVGKRSAELAAMAMQDNPQAHRQIVDELQNPDKIIRDAALEALKQADDRSVVPRMRQIAEQTDDPASKQAILDAVEFINLPSLTEYLHQHQK